MFVDGLLERSARLYPQKVALVFEGKRSSYRELLERVYKCAQGLAASGVEKGERVAVLSGNHPAFTELYFAVPHAGAVLTTINFRLQPPEIQYILNDAGAKLLFVEDRFFHLVEPILKETGVKKLVVIGEGKGEFLGYEAFIQKGQAVPLHLLRDPEDVCFQLYTSGTTGHPKGAMTTHKNWIFDCAACSLSLSISKEDRYLVAPPMFHAAAGVATVFSVMNATTVILMKDFVPEVALDLLEKEKVTRALFVPAMINFLLHTEGVKKRDYAALQTIIYGASPISETTLNQAMEIFKCGFWQAFGQTESVAVLTALLPEEHEGKKLKSCGREVHFCEVRIVDDKDQELPPGEIGEIIARGPMVMKGYYNLPEATEETLKNGWLHTGDMGMKDEEGYVYIMDRKKDMIVSGGENVYPAEVENVLAKHPAVQEAAVIGIPDEKWGETVLAVVVLRKDEKVSEEELMEFARANLAHFKCPKKVVFQESLPRNPSGKILKTVLREPYWKGRERRVH